MTSMDLAYRQTAAVGASGLSLLLPLFDRLAMDLRKGAEAQRAGDLERRSKELNHALAIIGFLANWVDENSGELAQQLASFYVRLRARIIVAEAQQSADILEEEMLLTLELRAIWQQVQLGNASSEVEILPPSTPQYYPAVGALQMEANQFSWSA